VLKLSNLEYQRVQGKLDLSHLKRNQIPKLKVKDFGDKADDILSLRDSLKEEELYKLAKLV